MPGRSFSHAASAALVRFSTSFLRAVGSLIASSPPVMSAVMSVNACATSTFWVGPAGSSSVLALARKPSST